MSGAALLEDEVLEVFTELREQPQMHHIQLSCYFIERCKEILTEYFHNLRDPQISSKYNSFDYDEQLHLRLSLDCIVLTRHLEPIRQIIQLAPSRIIASIKIRWEQKH
ncbi:hypothetical protein TNCV_3524061 [Trichonephila clavipes]|uniref:Uncharacterized protein n=1 Tax=Trichonephila clavipes TaxID=2585209 RepID=A0A8X6S8B2_TRICX|nr:hypothetical protein TNCV_3524061 [Trichonephila clavipes]